MEMSGLSYVFIFIFGTVVPKSEKMPQTPDFPLYFALKRHPVP